jgi:ATP-dependent Lon protease
LAWRSFGGAKCSTRTEPRLQRSLSRGRFRPRRDVHNHGQHAAHAAAADGPHGIIRIPGYTEDERWRCHAPFAAKQIKWAEGNEWSITDARCAIDPLLRAKRASAIERELANLARKAVKAIVSGKAVTIEVTAENLGEYAGVRKFRYGEMEGEDQVGVVTGLAWTEVGGETLTIESVMVPGKGRFQATGKLGDVMKESIDAARSYARSKATTFGIKPPCSTAGHPCPCSGKATGRASAGVGMATSIIRS